MDLENTQVFAEETTSIKIIEEEDEFDKIEKTNLLFFKNELDENNTEDERLGYSKISRFVIAAICIIIVTITYVTISESGNYALTDLKYAYPINFRMYINLIQLPFVVLFLGIYQFAGYNLIQKINEVGIHAAIFGIIFGLGCATFAITLRDLSPHFMMIIDSADLPVDFLIMIFFLKFPFNIWKAIVVIVVTAAIVISSVLMNTYFNENPRQKQMQDQNMLNGIIVSILCGITEILNDMQMFYFRKKYFSYDHPLLDAMLFYMLMTVFSAITMIMSCVIAGESLSPPKESGVWICIWLYSIMDAIGFGLEFYLIYIMDPIYLRVGVLFRIPLIFMLDFIFRGIFIHIIEIIGGTVVILSIISYGLITWYEEHSKKHTKIENNVLTETVNTCEDKNEERETNTKISGSDDDASTITENIVIAA